MSDGLEVMPGEALPPIARAAIADRLGVGRRLGRADLAASLLDPGAAFVTLHLGGGLRGCVGSLEATRALVDDVEDNACAAAFDDPRFPPLTLAEHRRVLLEVSVLGPLVPLAAADQDQLVARLAPGEDGLVLVAGDRRATFLPQVWASVPEPDRFIDQLRLKAGLGTDFWRLRPSFYRYRVRKWSEA